MLPTGSAGAGAPSFQSQHLLLLVDLSMPQFPHLKIVGYHTGSVWVGLKELIHRKYLEYTGSAQWLLLLQQCEVGVEHGHFVNKKMEAQRG